MSIQRIIGLVLLAVGVALLFFGYNASQSVGERVVEGVTGHFTNQTMWFLIGGIAAQYPAEQRIFFALGASTASVIWFFGLAYGARLLAPLFRKPIAWRVLDILIGIIMWGIAISLILGELS